MSNIFDLTVDVVFTKIDKDIRIHCTFANLYTLKRIENQIITAYKCFVLLPHHMVNYNIIY